VTNQIQDLGGQRRGVHGRNVRSTITLAAAAATALAASVTEAGANAREISESPYGFADSLWTGTAIERPGTLSPFIGGGTHPCSVNCGPAFGITVVRRSDLLTSNNADLSARKSPDANGHSMGVGGAIVVERPPERVRRNAGQFGPRMRAILVQSALRDDDPIRQRAVGGTAGPTPEPRTWMLLLIGFAGLTFASYRQRKTRQASTRREGMYRQ
jgi:hypothetical protein